jgi:hypothetical protein
VYSARVDEVDAYRRAGAHRCVFWVPPNDAAAARRRLDELAAVLRPGARRPPRLRTTAHQGDLLAS